MLSLPTFSNLAFSGCFFLFCLSESCCFREPKSDNVVINPLGSEFLANIIEALVWENVNMEVLRLKAELWAECRTSWGLHTWWECLPQSLHLLLGRPPWWWVPSRQGSGGLLPLSACPLSPWRTWSWRSWGLGDCWLQGIVVGCRAECPRHLGAVTDKSKTRKNDKRLTECLSGSIAQVSSPACWRALIAPPASCLFPLPPRVVLCFSWVSLRSDELVRWSDPSRGRYAPPPPLLSRPSTAFGEITPRPSSATLAGCVGDFSTAGGGMGGGGRSWG